MVSESTDVDGDAVTATRDEYIGEITLDRPERMNTFSTELAGELDATLHAMDGDDDVRAIVIHGAGDAFSAGIDVSEHAELETKDEYEQWVAGMEDPFHTLAEMRTPVISAAHGHAAANGIGLLAASDLAVAAAGTKLGATAPKVGLFCMGPAVPLRETMTRKRALELLLTGEMIDAETAREWGLVNRVAPEGDHLSVARDLAETIVSKSPTAVQMGKEAFSEMADKEYHEAIDFSNERFAELCTTADASAGISAFLDGEPLDADEWPGE
jgi:enoyl-CoA hydratase/carnithine racemase